MPAAATSQTPALRSAPVLIVSNDLSTICCFRPRSSATRSIRSTSNPTIFLPFSDWNGAYGRCVHVVNWPDLTSFTPPAVVVACSLLQAVADRASVAASTSGVERRTSLP